MNKRIKVDWDRWQDEEQHRDMMEDFDPDKLIELLKKNGDWDSDDEEQNPGEEMPEGENFFPDINEEAKEDEDRKDNVDQKNDEHMFEQYLRSGDYAFKPIKRNRAADSDDFDDEEL